jgi:hypothetical protein
MAKITRVKPKHKKFGPTTTGKDGYMTMPENRNKYKNFPETVAAMIIEKLDK